MRDDLGIFMLIVGGIIGLTTLVYFFGWEVLAVSAGFLAGWVTCAVLTR